MNSELLKEPNLDHWRNQPVSRISHHGSRCCETAQRWFLAKYLSRSCRQSRDSWAGSLVALLEDFTWGCSPWPLYWCELNARKHLDCGALSALSRDLLSRLGVRSHAIQVIQIVSPDEIRHFRSLWVRSGTPQLWLGERHIYHELCLIEPGPALSSVLFDSSFGTIIEDASSASFGGIVAMRAESERAISWAGHELPGGEWKFFA